MRGEADSIFDMICRELPAADVRFLMIGGHAVNYYGYSRATQDIDFMITATQLPTVRDIMKKAGYTNISESENVTFFSRPDSLMRVDFLTVSADTMRQLLEGAVAVSYGGRDIRVPRLADLLAMKIFAVREGPPRRRTRDLQDVENLARENKIDIERDLRPLCERFGNEGIYEELRDRLEEGADA